jgi:hypothetical protein
MHVKKPKNTTNAIVYSTGRNISDNVTEILTGELTIQTSGGTRLITSIATITIVIVNLAERDLGRTIQTCENAFAANVQ